MWWLVSNENWSFLWQVFHFIYTYALEIDVCPFTLDEFAQAFHDKVFISLLTSFASFGFYVYILIISLHYIQFGIICFLMCQDSVLLGKINIAFLKLLLSDVEAELNNGSSHLQSRSCNYLALFHSVSSHALSNFGIDVLLINFIGSLLNHCIVLWLFSSCTEFKSNSLADLARDWASAM